MPDSRSAPLLRPSPGPPRPGPSRAARTVVWTIALSALACSRGAPAPPSSTDGAVAPRPGAAGIRGEAAADADASPAVVPRPPPSGPSPDASPVSQTADAGAVGPKETTPARPPGAMADLDPANDRTTGPPDPVPDCDARLEAAGVRWTAAELPIRRLRNGDVCGVDRAVKYREGPTGIRWSPQPVASCGLALALARFEAIAQEEAARFLGAAITRIEQAGTTNCRRIARFPGMMSEHSYANGIDVRSFELANGRTISVKRWFGSTEEEPVAPEGRFLRALARRLYDEDVFSCVLTAFWDHGHDDHFHLDLARYRVDGTR